MPSTKASKRNDVLEAAMLLFNRHGFRKTSIDQIAARAEVAKPTVYAYFEDKEALFLAVCEYLCETILDDARRARDQGGGGVVARISGMLSAKFTRVFELVDSSPHAEELLRASRSDRAQRAIAAADARFAELLAAEIRDAKKRGELDPGALGLSISELVKALLQAAHGASYGADSAATHRANVDRLTRLVLAGASSRAAS